MRPADIDELPGGFDAECDAIHEKVAVVVNETEPLSALTLKSS